MVAKTEELIARLKSTEPATRLKAVKTVRDQIIGNRHRKAAFIKHDAVPIIVDILENEPESNLLVQCATVVGSFACGGQVGVEAVLKAGGAAPLVSLLTSMDERVVEAGVRSLKLVYEASPSQYSEVAGYVTRDVIQQIVQLLHSNNKAVAETAAILLALCCAGQDQQSWALEAGGLAGVLPLVFTVEPRRYREAGAAALSALIWNNRDALETAMAHPGLLQDLLACMKQPETPGGAFHAAACLTSLAEVLPSSSDPSPQLLREQSLQTLVCLLDKDLCREQAAEVVCRLLTAAPSLRRAASDAGAVGKLVGKLGQPGCTASQQVWLLRALELLTRDHEDPRQQLLESSGMPFIQKALEHHSKEVQAAACACLVSISRSVKSLRTICKVPDLVPLLMHLLRDPLPSLQAEVCATLCNLGIACSPLQDDILRAGALPALAELVLSPCKEVVVNASWALANIMVQASAETLFELMAAAPFSSILELTAHPSEEIRENGIRLLQNISAHSDPTIVEGMLRWSTDADGTQQLLPLLCTAVSGSLEDSDSDIIKEAALSAICNLAATGGEVTRAKIMEAGVVPHLTKLLHHQKSSVCTMALWVIINLCTGDSEGPGSADRIAALRSLGLQEVVERLQENAEELDVRERIQNTLDILGETSGPGVPMSPE